MASIDWNTSDAEKGFDRLEKEIEKAADKAIEQTCDEILRVGTFEVPHNKGLLQASGAHEPTGEHERTVGYNKVYAARLHEHPEYHFQKGRKGKYLIDPILKNLDVFQRFQQDAINGVMS